MAELMNEVQNINEAADELLLLDEDDAQSIPYKFGQTFVHFNSVSLESFAFLYCISGFYDGEIGTTERSNSGIIGSEASKFLFLLSSVYC